MLHGIDFNPFRFHVQYRRFILAAPFDAAGVVKLWSVLRLLELSDNREISSLSPIYFKDQRLSVHEAEIILDYSIAH